MVNAALAVAKAMIISVIDYGNAFLTGCTVADLDDLDVIQNNSLNIHNPRDIHTDLLMRRANVLSLQQKRLYELLSSPLLSLVPNLTYVTEI